MSQPRNFATSCLLVVFVGACAAKHVTPIATVPLAYDAPQPIETIASTPAPDSPSVLEVAGFAVHVSPAARLQPELHDFLLALEVHLAEVVRTFPVLARLDLRRTGIYLTEREPHGPVFHTTEQWLHDHDMDVGLARNIEVPSVRVALEQLRAGDRTFAFLVAAGYLARHADATDLAYLARVSAAYFGEPDRARLCAADEKGCARVRRAWPVEHAPDLPREADVEHHAIAGFDVWVAKSIAQRSEARDAIAIVTSELDKLDPYPAALARLRGTKIVIRAATDAKDTHAVWFHDGFVDLPDAAAFVASRTGSPHSLLHELGHALDAARPDLSARREAAYRHAMNEHLYDASAYATVSSTEYFAELSKAFLASSRVPGTHTRLKEADPMGYALASDAWTR